MDSRIGQFADGSYYCFADGLDKPEFRGTLDECLLALHVADSGFAGRITLGNGSIKTLFQWFQKIEQKSGKSVDENVRQWLKAHSTGRTEEHI